MGVFGGASDLLNEIGQKTHEGKMGVDVLQENVSTETVGHMSYGF